VSGQGLDELAAAIGKHRAIAFDAGAGRERRLAIAGFRLRKTAENLLLERFGDKFERGSSPLAARLAERSADPYTLANELLEDNPRSAS
jgi:LAO/AO transport system kinase